MFIYENIQIGIDFFTIFIFNLHISSTIEHLSKPIKKLKHRDTP